MNKNIYIIGGIAIVGVVGYMLYTKSKSDQVDDTTPAKEAETTPGATTTDATTKTNRKYDAGKASKTMPTSSKVGGVALKGGSTPSTLSPTDPSVSSGVVVNTGKYSGITDADFLRMEQARKDAEIANPYPSNATSMEKGQIAYKIKQAIIAFAKANGINYYAYTQALAKNTSVTNFCNETDSFAFTLSF